MAQRRYEFCDESFLRRLERLHLIAKRRRWRETHGVRRSRRLGDGLEFADHRSYFPGDDIRFVDWPYYARMERLLLRLFHQHSDTEVAILLDCSASMDDDGEKFNAARKIVTAMAYVAMGGLDRILVAPVAEGLGRPLRLGRDRRRIFQLLDYLQSLHPSGRTQLRHCTEGFTQRYSNVGAILLVSDLLGCRGDLREALVRLGGSRGDLAVIHIVGPSDARPTAHGPVLLEDAETAGRIAVDAGDKLLQAYASTWDAFCRECQRICLGLGVTYAIAPSDVPFERLILSTLRQRGVLED